MRAFLVEFIITMISERTRYFHSFLQESRKIGIVPSDFRGTELMGPLAGLGRKEYMQRISEFSEACEYFHILLSSTQLGTNVDPQLSALKQMMGDKPIPTFNEFVDMIRSIPRTVGDSISNRAYRSNQPEKYFSHMLVRGYGSFFMRISGDYKTTQPAIRALEETIIKYYSDSALAKDLADESIQGYGSQVISFVLEEGSRNPFLFLLDVSTFEKLGLFLNQISPSPSIERRRKLIELIKDTIYIGPTVAAFLDSSSVEQQYFGNVFLDLMESIFEELSSKEFYWRGSSEDIVYIVHKVLDTSCEDGKAFWTFSPYLFDMLKKQISEEEALKRVLLWAKDGHPDEEGHDPTKVHLKGLEFLQKEPTYGKMYSISKNAQGLSHAFTKILAQRIIEEHLLTDEFDPEKALL